MWLVWTSALWYQQILMSFIDTVRSVPLNRIEKKNPSKFMRAHNQIIK